MAACSTVGVDVSQRILSKVSALIDVCEFGWITVALRQKASWHHSLSSYLLFLVGIAILNVYVLASLVVSILNLVLVLLSILVNLDLIREMGLA